MADYKSCLSQIRLISSMSFKKITIHAGMAAIDAMYCQNKTAPHSFSQVWYIAHTACTDPRSLRHRLAGLNRAPWHEQYVQQNIARAA